MERLVGTVSRGIRAPIIREGDDIAKIVKDTMENITKLSVPLVAEAKIGNNWDEIH